LDDNGRLQPWTSYDNTIRWSINFIVNCPTIETKFGDDPWYLVTAKFNENGTFRKKQNNQGSNVYWAVETHRKYYAYSGDRASLAPVRTLLERVAYYHTQADWAWPNVPRTQDDTLDGEYTDEWSGVDKICMAAVGYLNYYKLTGEEKYLQKAVDVAKTVVPHIQPGDADHSPLPFRVNLRTGEIRGQYTANMIPAINLLDELIDLNPVTLEKSLLIEKRNIL